MTQEILSGVSKKMRVDFYNGNLSETMLVKQYERNYKEAMDFSIFGYNILELKEFEKESHNPILKHRLKQVIEDVRNRQVKSGEQNKISINKLNNFKECALGIGLRKVISKLRIYCKHHDDEEAKLILLLLEIEFANLSAKQNYYKRNVKSRIYKRKEILLRKVQPILKHCGWKYGYNDAGGKNASYIIYVYMPNDVQLSWHSNDYYLYKYYPFIDIEWDGQVCMTMEKILNYINDVYLNKID